MAIVTAPVNPVAVFPNGSRAVTCTAGVIVEAAVVVVGWTVKASWLAAAAVTVTVSVCMTAVLLIVAETIFCPATVALRLLKATPAALVPPVGCGRVAPAPLTANWTVAPAIALSNPSRAVAVTVAALPPAVMVRGFVTSNERVADTAAGPTVTVAVWVIGTPLTVALTVFVSAIVADKVPVATPVPSVGPVGDASAFPVPVALSATVAPGTGLPLASFAVTVIVATLAPLEAVIALGATEMVDKLGEIEPAMTLKLALVPPVSPVAVAASVYPVPALSTLRVENVAIPAAAANAFVPESVAPPGFVASATAIVPV
jgi:hypothetical protein